MATPRVSVILPAYNADAFVAESIASIQRQTFTDWELIVIDDGSTDQTAAKISPFLSDERVQYLRNEQNLGLVKTLNKALDLARGEIIARIDADDIARPTRLEKQVALLDSHPDVQLCGTWFRYIDSETIIRAPVTDEEIRIYALENNPFGHPTVAMRASALKALGRPIYDPAKYPAEDYALWLRFLEMGRAVNIPEVLLDYRIHQNQISHSNESQIRRSNEVRREWVVRAAPLFRFLPAVFWRAMADAFQGHPLRLRRALAARGLFYLFACLNGLGATGLNSQLLREFLATRNPMPQHHGWQRRWIKKIAGFSVL